MRPAGGTLVQDGEGFSCVSTDSRRVEQGCLFIPLVGERFDGHTYLTQGAGERRCGLPVQPPAGGAGAGEVLCAGGGYPPGAGTAGGVVSGEIPHPRCADHRAPPERPPPRR